MKVNGPADSISHSFKGILEARDTELFRLAGENTQVGRFSEEGGGEGKDRGHTSSVSGKMREALFVLRHTSVRQCQVSISGARARDGSLSLAKTSRDFRYISSTMISQSVLRCRERMRQ